MLLYNNRSFMSSPDIEKSNRGCHYILVVEDNQDIANVAKNTLEDEGLKVFTAGHPPEAFKIILELERLGLTPSTVITDLNMPFMDGFKFKKVFSNRYRDIDVLLMTATPDESIERYQRNGGVVIRKPFDLDELCNYVAESERYFRMRKEIPLA